MRFIWQDALWLLVCVPLLAGAYELIVRRGRAREAVRHTDLRLIRAADGVSQRLRRRLPPLLFLLGITALLLAVARPAAVFLLPAHRGTVVLAMDVSISMAATDVKPTRLAAAQAAAAEFVRKVPPGIRIGVVAFGGYAEVVRWPTVDKAQVLNSLSRLQLQQYTAIGTALLAALVTVHPGAAVDPKYDLFSRTDNLPEPWTGASMEFPVKLNEKPAAGTRLNPSAFIILVSDGKGTLGVPESKAAEMVAAYGIRVYTIGVGTAYGGVAHVEGSHPIHAEFEEDTLKMVADLTNAEYFNASNPDKLKRIYEALSEEAIRERRETEVSALLAALGGFLLVLGASLSLAWHDRLA
jgi:Ca-activated chloride channel family protein